MASVISVGSVSSRTKRSSKRQRNPNSTSSTFHLFPLFPSEIRHLIWIFSLPSPRLVHLQQRSLRSYNCPRVRSDCTLISPLFFQPEEPGYRPLPSRGFRSFTPKPQLLFVCKEAQNIALQYFRQGFGSLAARPETWFDFKNDMLFLDWKQLGQSFGPGDMSVDIRSVRRLAFYYMPSMLHPRLDARYLFHILEAFGNLEEVLLVFWSSFRGEKYFVVDEDVEVVEPVIGGEYIRAIYTQPYSPRADKILARLKAADGIWKLNVEAQIEDVRAMHKEWKMPRIELKSLVAKGFCEWCEKEGREYEGRKERFRIHLTLRAPGVELLKMDVKEDMTIAEVVRVFREEKNIDDEEEVAVFNGSGDELTQSATFYDLEFFRHRPAFEVELTVSVWRTCVEDPVIDDWMRLIDPINAL